LHRWAVTDEGSSARQRDANFSEGRGEISGGRTDLLERDFVGDHDTNPLKHEDTRSREIARAMRSKPTGSSPQQKLAAAPLFSRLHNAYRAVAAMIIDVMQLVRQRRLSTPSAVDPRFPEKRDAPVPTSDSEVETFPRFEHLRAAAHEGRRKSQRIRRRHSLSDTSAKHGRRYV
jgi:hypothetical protein